MKFEKSSIDPNFAEFDRYGREIRTGMCLAAATLILTTRDAAAARTILRAAHVDTYDLERFDLTPEEAAALRQALSADNFKSI